MRLKRNSKGRFVKRSASGGHRRRRRRRHVAHAAPVRRRRRRRHVARFSNPRRRRRRSYAVRHISRRRRRRNPRGFLGGLAGGGLMKPLVGAGIGAVGAVGLDVLLGYAKFLPDSLRTGTPRHFVRLGAAVLGGWAVGKFLKKPQLGAGITLGAMTVVLYGIARDLLQKAAPNLPGLGDYEEMEVGYLDAASVIPDGTGAYLVDDTGTGAYMEGVDDTEGAGAYLEF